jgi:ABC-type multidrug transport system fused ATPase/permease subunit
MYAHLTECSEGVEHIRAFQWEERRLSKAWNILDKSQKLFYFRQCIQHWLGLVLDLLVTATGVFLVALALYQGSTTQASLGLGLLKVMQIGPDLLYFVEQWVGLEDSLAALSRIRAFEKETPREGTGAGRDGISTVPENWPHEGHIRVDNVSANYSVEGVEHTTLHELSVNIAPGTKVGLVGRTGSGKSSFLLTLLNFLNFSGSIVIDGIDITTIPRHILRSRITTISQEFMSLPSSVRNNLVPQEIMKAAGERTGDVELLNALEKVGLKRLVESRGGLDKPLEEVGLSGGEQQLLALARALVHHGRVKGKIIFMDEATSYIDYDSEAKLQQVTTEVFADCTVLTIAHRHHTLNNTTLLELSAGHLVAYG